MVNKDKQSKPDRHTYKDYDNALCLTMHTLDGSELTPEAQREAENAILAIAVKYGYVINIAKV